MEPEVPHVGSNGKPWREQKSQLVPVGTAQAGSLRLWPLCGHSPANSSIHDDMIFTRPPSPAAPRAKRSITVTPIADANLRSYMFFACSRKTTFCLVYKSRVPVRLIWTVAPALKHLTRSMVVQGPRDTHGRPAAVGTPLATSPSKVRRAPPEAYVTKQLCRTPTRPARHRNHAVRPPQGKAWQLCRFSRQLAD